MRSQPHIVVANFERRVLRSLNLAYYAMALYDFWHHWWISGLAILILSLGLGAIGQGLPHRKRETASELATGGTIERGLKGELSLEDSGALSKAFLFTDFLVCVSTPVVLSHSGWTWYWIILAMAAELPLLPLAFGLLAVGPLDTLRLFWKKRGSVE
jgi:hypothetical protein